MGLENIDHIVVLMMENRSLDNLLGWLYGDSQGAPLAFYPQGATTPYDGLSQNKYFNQLNGETSPKVYATHPPTAWPSCPQPTQTPTPDPHEEFAFVTKQLFGDKAPVPGVPPDMTGFLENYATTSAGQASAGQIMQGFGPKDVPIISKLARSFAVSDRWFASAPTQTWPNRGFVHTGSSDGHIDNENYEPYANRTIFNALEDRGKTWGVFHDTDIVPSLTHVQFLQLWDKGSNFQKFDEFRRLCAAPADSGSMLPSYSFLEPRFVPEPRWWWPWSTKYPSDYHPPHDVLRGEQFLARAYEAVRSSPYRDRILLVVTFDEHGGCYDHVPPPWGSLAPLPGPTATKAAFGFDRFGVRVPTLLISSCVEAGTVFRSDGPVPFDHASILATVRDWLGLGSDPTRFLPSPRIQAAPKLDGVLKPTLVNTDWPTIPVPMKLWWRDTSKDTELNDVQKSLLAHMKRRDSADAGPGSMEHHAVETRNEMHTIRHALDYLRTKAPGPSRADASPGART